MSAGVVVGYDGSEGAREALRVALEVAKTYGEKVIVAFGFDTSPVGGELQDYQAALRELAEERLSQAREASRSSGVEVEGTVVEQAPARALVELADERDARVIVVGTRGESPLKGALIGSTPHKLLQLTNRPVLVVPTGD